jgi:hypothetical protein
MAAMLNKTQARSYFRFASWVGKQLGSSPGRIDAAMVDAEKMVEYVNSTPTFFFKKENRSNNNSSVNQNTKKGLLARENWCKNGEE